MPSLKSRLYYYVVKFHTSRVDLTPDIDALRASLEQLCTRFPMPTGVGVEPTTVNGRRAEWLTPKDADRTRAVLYLHGGAYTRGSLDTHRAFAARIALASSAPVLLVDYRLAPEAPFPCGLDDAVAAFESMTLERGLPPSAIAVAGDSAGGGLAVALALRLRDEERPLPACIVCMSPWVDLGLSGESVSTRARVDPIFATPRTLHESAALYANEADLEHPYVSPVYAELSALPPLFIQVGDCEILLSDSTTLATRAREARVEVTLEVCDGMWHLWQMFAAELRDAQEAIDRVGAFIKSKTHG